MKVVLTPTVTLCQIVYTPSYESDHMSATLQWLAMRPYAVLIHDNEARSDKTVSTSLSVSVISGKPGPSKSVAMSSVTRDGSRNLPST